MSYLSIPQPAHEAVVFSTESEAVFLPIPGFPNHEISFSCVIRDIKTGHVLPHKLLKASCRFYERCTLGLVHRVFMSAIFGRPLARDELVCHRNGNTFDNSPDNLRVGTAKSNSIDKISTNTNGKKLRNNQVREIRRLATTRTRRQIALMFNITPRYVGDIITGRSWFNLP